MITASVKTTKTKLIGILCIILAFVIAFILFFGNKSPEKVAESISLHVADNEERKGYLLLKGIETAPEPISVQEVLLPKDDAIFEKYCKMQKEAGFDLSSYLGKKVIKYVYEVLNEDEVYATLYVYDNVIIATDIASHTEGWQKPVDGKQNIR